MGRKLAEAKQLMVRLKVRTKELSDKGESNTIAEAYLEERTGKNETFEGAYMDVLERIAGIPTNPESDTATLMTISHVATLHLSAFQQFCGPIPTFVA